MRYGRLFGAQDGNLFVVVSLTHEELVRPSAFYERRKDELRTEVGETKARISKHTLTLVVLALVVSFLLYRAIFVKQRSLLWVGLPVIPFGAWIVQQRHRLYDRCTRLCSVSDFYDGATARLARDWDVLDDGGQFVDPAHLYSSDLDLFGHGSMYQLLCSAQTQVGRETLSCWMKSPAVLEEIHARQQAIDELRTRRDLPELIAAVGPTHASDFNPEFLKGWVAEPLRRFPEWAPLVAFSLPIILIAVVILYGLGFIPLARLVPALEVVLVGEFMFGASFRSRVKTVLNSLPALSVSSQQCRSCCGSWNRSGSRRLN